MSFYGWKLFTLSHDFFMFGGHWFSANGDLTYDLKIEPGLCDFMGGASHCNLPFLVDIGIVLVDICFLIFHVILHGHLFKG